MALGFSAASLFFFASISLSLCAIAVSDWGRFHGKPNSFPRSPPSPPYRTPDSGFGRGGRSPYLTPDWAWDPPAPAGGTPPDSPPAGCTPPGWPYGGLPASGGSSNIPPLPSPKVIMVGGDKKWSFGTNYTDWVKKAGTLYVNDVLEFDYPLPVNGRMSINHSVHLLKDKASFQSCNLSGSVRVGNEYAGGAQGGFKFLLGMKPLSEPYYYFACGEKDGFNCNRGTMKFAVMPILRWG